MKDYFVEDLGCNGVFETMRSYDGEIFKLDRHIKRLFESCKTAGINLTKTKSQIKSRLKAELKKSRIKNARIRIALYQDSKNHMHEHIWVKKLSRIPKQYYSKGISITTSVTKRHTVCSQPPQIKSSNFLNSVLAHCDMPYKHRVLRIPSTRCLSERSERRGEYILFLNTQGFVAEGSTWNIFMIKNNILYTPPCSQGILPGVTRQFVIDLAQGQNIQVKEEPLTRHDLYNADEVFITNTSYQIMPVVEVDRRIIANHKPGEITKALIGKFL